nr:hypothetical protein [Tanacetum cinerariifolium]
MGRDTIQLETAVNTISHEYLLEFTSKYGIPETLHHVLPGPKDRIVDFPKGRIGVYTSFFWVDERVFPIVVDWRTNAPKDGMPAGATYSLEAVRVLDTHRTPIQKQPEMLLCLVRISRRYYLGDEVYPIFLHDDVRDMDLFNLIRASNPTKVKVRSRPHAPHEVPLLTLTCPCVIVMDEPAATDSSGIPSTIERSPLDFAHEAGASDQGAAAPEIPSSEDLGLASSVVPEDAPVGVSDPDPVSFADAPLRHPADVAKSSQGIAAAGDPGSENVSSLAEVGSPGSVYRSEWGITNGSLLDTPEACQDLVDHVAPLGYFSELRHMHNEEFLGQYHINLARQVAMGSQLRLRFEQEAKLLRKSVSGEEKLKAAFEEFKRYEDERVEQRCAELDAFADVVSTGVAKGMSKGLKHGVEHGHAQLKRHWGGCPIIYTRPPPSSSQLTIPMYPEVRDPRHPWAYKEEMKLSDAIVANITRAEKKKKCRIICRTHGVGSAHHARSDDVPMSVPTVVPQGLALLLMDMATQTDLEDLVL